MLKAFKTHNARLLWATVTEDTYDSLLIQKAVGRLPYFKAVRAHKELLEHGEPNRLLEQGVGALFAN